MSLEEYADKFRPRNKYVPEQLYGKLAKLENIAAQQRKGDEVEKSKVFFLCVCFFVLFVLSISPYTRLLG